MARLDRSSKKTEKLSVSKTNRVSIKTLHKWNRVNTVLIILLLVSNYKEYVELLQKTLEFLGY